MLRLGPSSATATAKAAADGACCCCFLARSTAAPSIRASAGRLKGPGLPPQGGRCFDPPCRVRRSAWKLVDWRRPLPAWVPLGPFAARAIAADKRQRQP